LKKHSHPLPHPLPTLKTTETNTRRIPSLLPPLSFVLILGNKHNIYVLFGLRSGFVERGRSEFVRIRKDV